LVVLFALPACDIYFGGDDGDDDCTFDDPIAGVGLRNPETGDCQFFGGGGGGCDGDDGAITLPVEPNEGPGDAPDWGACPSECEALSEAACWAADRCRAVYLQEGAPPPGPCEDGACDEAPQPANGAFLGCWAIAPSGPANNREACESLDAYECSRHNDCVGYYEDLTFRDRAAEAPSHQFVACGPEPILGCYGDEECPSGWDCTADTECLPPPGCDPNGESDQACPAVCYGRCEPPPNACDAIIECQPGYHCEERCYPCDDADGDGICPPICEAECVPDVNECPIECPPGSQCAQVCVDCGGTPGNDDGFDCEPSCWWECIPGGPNTCEDVVCGPGEQCELQCAPEPEPQPDPDPDSPGDPLPPGGGGGMGECFPVCVPIGGGSCSAIDCGPGFHCEEQCTVPPPCVPGEVCEGPSCGPICVPNNDPGECTGDVFCDSLPPTCPAGTTPGIRNGCWTGYCIPLSDCGAPPPPACEAIVDEMACIAAQPACLPIYTGTCWMDPMGQWHCTDTSFVRCDVNPSVPPQPLPFP
jgi:hypothetical protein